MKRNKAGVSPVVANILLIAIAVVAVGVVMAFVAGMGRPTTPTIALVDIEEAANGGVILRHMSGDQINNAFKASTPGRIEAGDWLNIEVRVNGAKVDAEADFNGAPVGTGTHNLTVGDLLLLKNFTVPLSAGDLITVVSVSSGHELLRKEYSGAGVAGVSYMYVQSEFVYEGGTDGIAGAQGDDGNYEDIFENNYPATAKTNAFIGYRDSTATLNTPKERMWAGDIGAWGSQSEMPGAGSPVRHVRVAYCPIEARSFEKIAVTLSDDGYLDAYVWNGTSWDVTNNIGQVWTSAPSDARRPYDVVYESQSGRALLVYGTTVAGGGNDLAYRIWSFGSGWGAEQYFDDTGHGAKITVTYVNLASDPRSNSVGAAYIDSANSDANAVIWDGSSWGNFIEITGTVAITTEECVGVAAESGSGAFVAVAGEGQFIKWARFAGSWSPVGIFDINSGATSAMNWLKLSSSQNDRIMLVSVDSANDLCTALLDESSVGNRQWETAAQSIGSMTASTSVTALRFTAQVSKSVENIRVYIQAVAASPAYRFGIETSTAGYLPSGTYVEGGTNYAVVTPSATGWLNVTLPSPASLTAGTVYHITVRYDSGTIGASNYIALRRLGANRNGFRPKENAIDPWLNTIFGTAIQNRDPVFVLQYTDGTFEAMPYDSASAHNIYGARWFSQKWTQSESQTIVGVNIPLVKTGTPPDNLYIVLRNETDSQDVATIVINQGDITTTLQWYEKYFSSPVTLVNGKVYRLILRSPSSTSSAYFTCRSLLTNQSGDLTYGGVNSVYSQSTTGGSSWTDTTTRDLTYIILLSNAGTAGWVIHPPWDGGVDTNVARCADFAWEYWNLPKYRNQGILVYGTTAGQITWRRFRAPNYMTAATNTGMGTNIHPWVQLKTNPRDIAGDVKILGAVLEGTVFDLGAVGWDGTTFTVTGATTFSADTTVITYESFEMEFGLPTLFRENVQHDITGITTADNYELQIKYYLAGDSEAVSVYLYNFTTSNWVNVGSLTSASLDNFIYDLTSTNYISGGEVRVRYVQPDNDSSQTSLMVDYCRVRVKMNQ